MGDSILSQIREDNLCKKGTIKVRCLPSITFDDFYCHYAIPLINKKPDRTVFNMGTNNVPYCTSEKMAELIKYCDQKILSCRNFQLVKLHQR